MSRGVCIQNVKRGVHSKCQEGCAFKMLRGVCIQIPRGVCIQNMMRCVHSKLSRGVRIRGCALPIYQFTNFPMHSPLASFECTPLYISVELWSDPVGARRRWTKALRRRAPRGKCLRVREFWRQIPCVVEATAFGCGVKCL